MRDNSHTIQPILFPSKELLLSLVSFALFYVKAAYTNQALSALVLTENDYSLKLLLADTQEEPVRHRDATDTANKAYYSERLWTAVIL
jgi:hypothetical protein